MTKQFKFGQLQRKYFKTINENSTTGKIDNLMEQFMLLALVGLVANKTANPETENRDMVQNFAGRTKTHQGLIRALLFYRFAKMNAYNEKDPQIMKAIQIFFDEEEQSKLGEEGYEYLNRSAAAGFEIIRGKIGAVYDLATFLISYIDLLVELDSNNIKCE